MEELKCGALIMCRAVFSFNGKPLATVLLVFLLIEYNQAPVFLEARFPVEMPAEPREPVITGLNIVHFLTIA